MPPRKRQPAVRGPETFGPGDRLMLDDADPVVCVALDGENALVRAGTAHRAPLRVLSSRVRPATEAEQTDRDYYFAKQLRSARERGELEAM